MWCLYEKIHRGSVILSTDWSIVYKFKSVLMFIDRSLHWIKFLIEIRSGIRDMSFVVFRIFPMRIKSTVRLNYMRMNFIENVHRLSSLESLHDRSAVFVLINNSFELYSESITNPKYNKSSFAHQFPSDIDWAFPGVPN